MKHKNRNFTSQTDVDLNRIAWRTQREIPMDIAQIEILLNEQHQYEELLEERESRGDKKERMVKELFVAATKVLTDVQFQVFTSYYVLGMSEVQIAESLGVTQPYISIVVKACIKKIKRQIKSTESKL